MPYQFDPRAIIEIISVNQRRLRLLRKMTQKTLADDAGLDPTHVERIERGRHNVTVLTLARIATALEVPPYRLLVAEDAST